MATRDPIRDHFFEANLFRSRAIMAATVCAALLLLLAGRLFFLQGIGHSHYATLSTSNRVRLMAVAPTRGLVFDRDGVLLAENLPSYRLELTPESIPDMDRTLASLHELLEFSDNDVSRLRKALRRKRPFEGIPLLDNLSDDQVARMAANRHRFPGVDIAARLSRNYPLGDLTAHVLGYVGRIDERELLDLDPNNYSGTSYVGKIGIEKQYEDLLHGSVGFQQVEVNAEGRILRVLEEMPPVPGKDIYLTLEIALQTAAREALGESSGAVVALDPLNGDVLAMISQPAFDPNPFVSGISASTYAELSRAEERPLFNRALSGQYPPGSIIKPFLGLAALETGLQPVERVQFCRGYYMLPNDERRYRDWKKHGHGVVDLRAAIAQSCDVYFYDLALRLGIDRIAPYLAAFGFGTHSGIDSTGEAEGLLPSRAWKRKMRNEPWFPGETLITGIGQGYLAATPLQLASATATLASGGVRMRPRLLASVATAPGTRDTRGAQVLSRMEIVDQAHWESILAAMQDVVHDYRGTAFSSHRDVGYRVAGKTGTAQVVAIAQDGEYDADKLARELRDHALYVAYAPVRAPRIAVAVLVEHGGSGGRVAAPVARRVMDEYLLRGTAAAEVRD
ncbi:MAG: penicillin-binding protein 2 [Gammaproteobacteria bacterium]|nr:penicillin-binding protein 2 [Gammaproteobacteria bacterium]